MYNKNKYIKYKNKYLNLQKSLGSINPDTQFQKIQKGGNNTYFYNLNDIKEINIKYNIDNTKFLKISKKLTSYRLIDRINYIKSTILKKFNIDEGKYTETITKIHPRIHPTKEPQRRESY